MMERFNNALDNKHKFGALLIQIYQKRLIVLSMNLSLLIYMHIYLGGNIEQRLIIASVHELVSQGIPQGSIFGPLLFNRYINDICFVRGDRITNYADDTTPYTINKHYKELVDVLQLDSHTLLDWFTNNFFKLNPDKCKLLISWAGWFINIYWRKNYNI